MIVGPRDTLNRSGLLVLLFILLGIAVCAQQPTGSPATSASAPRPAATRRTFDQFDLSNGGGMPAIGSSNQVSNAVPTTIEPVDELLFEVVNQLNDSALFLDEELGSALKQNADISSGSQFSKFFVHRINGIMMLSETHRLGLLGMPAVKSEPNKKLLFKVQDSANDIIQVIAVGPGGYTRDLSGWNGLSAKYNVPLLDTAPDDLRLDKPALLKAMMRRMITDLAQLKQQLVVKK